MRPSPHVSYPFWAGVPCRLRPQGSEAGAGHEPPGASVPLPQNCGSPSILDGPGPFTVFVPSNEAVDRLRDGRLIYLFTAVSWREGLWEGEAPAPPLCAFGSQAPSPCQGLSKLQELVRHHIYSRSQVRGLPWGHLRSRCAQGLLSLPSGPPQRGGEPRAKAGAASHLGGAGCGPKSQLASISLRPPCPPPQLTVEKLISKGRVVSMANQVIAVNVTEEVSSTGVWKAWTSEGLVTTGR